MKSRANFISSFYIIYRYSYITKAQQISITRIYRKNFHILIDKRAYIFCRPPYFPMFFLKMSRFNLFWFRLFCWQSFIAGILFILYMTLVICHRHSVKRFFFLSLDHVQKSTIRIYSCVYIPIPYRKGKKKKTSNRHISEKMKTHRVFLFQLVNWKFVRQIGVVLNWHDKMLVF